MDEWIGRIYEGALMKRTIKLYRPDFKIEKFRPDLLKRVEVTKAQAAKDKLFVTSEKNKAR
jgi:hypothetical protein